MRLLAVLIVLSGLSCRPSDVTGPTLVRPSDLASAFRDGPRIYAGRVVIVPVGDWTIEGPAVHWHLLADRQYPAVLVFNFAESPALPAGGVVWIQGTCGERVRDDVYRGLPGYGFSVALHDCQLVPPPTSTVPVPR